MRNNLRVDEVEDAAAAWLLKREGPDWSAADEAQLAAWLKASTSHRVAFVRLGAVWREANRMKVLRAGFPSGQAPPRGAIGRSPFFSNKRRAAAASPVEGIERASALRSGRLKWKYGLAAGVLLAAILGLDAYLSLPGAPTYRTPVGGLATVPMEDGSRITLNTASEITLAITSKERRVTITQGEAFFEVAKDPSRPFVVYAKNHRVIAIGTKFSVRLKPEAVQVAVTEGKVRLEHRRSLLNLVDDGPDRRQTGAASTGWPLLTPGIIASARDATVSIEQQAVADVEQALSWRAGHVVLRKAQLSEAVAEFNRYNRRQLVIADQSLRDIRVGGNFKSDNIDGFVRLLEEGFEIRAHERDGRIVLTRR